MVYSQVHSGITSNSTELGSHRLPNTQFRTGTVWMAESLILIRDVLLGSVVAQWLGHRPRNLRVVSSILTGSPH